MHARALLAAPLVLLVAGTASAQAYRDFTAPSYRDFEVVRNRPWPYVSALTVRAGLAGVIAADENKSIGREDDFAPDGFVWYRTDQFTSNQSNLDAYVGRDGAIVSIVQEELTEGSSGRLEIGARYFPFYREGYYRGDDWVPTGQYDSMDYGAYLGFSTAVGEGATLEIGPFYRRYEFDRSDLTGPGYAIPEDFNAYGARLYFEQSTLQIDPQRSLPYSGFLATLRGEYERNDSNETFGTALWATRLPTAFWRGLLHLEWYFPTEGSSVWELRVDGEINDDKDRIHIYDAQKPIGEYWGDATVGYRLELARGLYLTPFGQLQYTKTADESGLGSGDDFWFGGGARFRFDLSDQITVLGDYSYLNNANRPSISYDQDVFGEHQFFVGAEVRFGASKY